MPAGRHGGRPLRGDFCWVRLLHSAPVDSKCQLRKETAEYRKPLSFRDQCSHWSWESVSFIDGSIFPRGVKENGLPRRFAPRNDRVTWDGAPIYHRKHVAAFLGRHSGRELSCTLSFPFCSYRCSGDPFPQCAHWGLPLKGAALHSKDLKRRGEFFSPRRCILYE